MNENIQNGNGFIGYEYKSMTVRRDVADLCADCYPSFGWTLEAGNLNSGKLKFKRNRKIINKAELTRLQRQFESHINEITKLEVSKTTAASIAAYTIGILGTAFMAGSVFAVTSNMILLCIILAVPAFIGWMLPYFCYKRIAAKKSEKITQLIEQQYDAIYETCEKANALLYK